MRDANWDRDHGWEIFRQYGCLIGVGIVIGFPVYCVVRLLIKWTLGF